MPTKSTQGQELAKKKYKTKKQIEMPKTTERKEPEAEKSQVQKNQTKR